MWTHAVADCRSSIHRSASRWPRLSVVTNLDDTQMLNPRNVVPKAGPRLYIVKAPHWEILEQRPYLRQFASKSCNWPPSSTALQFQLVPCEYVQDWPHCEHAATCVKSTSRFSRQDSLPLSWLLPLDKRHQAGYMKQPLWPVRSHEAAKSSTSLRRGHEPWAE